LLSSSLLGIPPGEFPALTTNFDISQSLLHVDFRSFAQASFCTRIYGRKNTPCEGIAATKETGDLRMENKTMEYTNGREVKQEKARVCVGSIFISRAQFLTIQTFILSSEYPSPKPTERMELMAPFERQFCTVARSPFAAAGASLSVAFA